MILPAPFEWINIPHGKVTLDDGHGIFDVPAFEIGKYPITNAQFALFIDDNGYMDKRLWTDTGWEWRVKAAKMMPAYWQDHQWNGADHPVVGISWYESLAFCRWLGEKSGRNILLPTEQQWQRAAQGEDRRQYPWGDIFDKTRCNSGQTGIHNTTPVTAYPDGVSPYGVMDMSGNVWEWTLTDYNSATSKDTEPSVGRVVRGGSFLNPNEAFLRTTHRFWYHPAEITFRVGFRCVQVS